MPELRRGMVVWVELDPARGGEQGGRRPAVVVASDAYLAMADTLAIVVPGTTTRRDWPNHVPLSGTHLELPQPTFAMTEQPRTITRGRICDHAGEVDRRTMERIDQWLGDFLAL